MSRPFSLPCVLPALLVLAGCERLFGGDFGNDPDAAMARMKQITTLFSPGELAQESVWEPGDGITHIRFMYAAAAPSCAEAMMATICAETGDIRKKTGAKVEAWCHGATAATVEVCMDGRRLPRFTR